jgi:predicted nucleotidyltransferase
METADAIRRLQELRGPLEEAGIRALYLFGSMARGTAGEASDVDLFVDPDYDRFDFVALMRAESRLSERLGRRVDLMTREGLHPGLRAKIESEAIRVI